MEPIIDNRLKIIFKKKKEYIQDGIVSYPISIKDDKIICLCNGTLDKYGLCKHVSYYLYKSGLDITLCEHWSRIKKDIIKEIKTKTVDNKKLWTIVDEQVFNAECGFCVEKISIYSNYVVCDFCKNISHKKCFNKWNQQNKGCMYCRK